VAPIGGGVVDPSAMITGVAGIEGRGDTVGVDGDMSAPRTGDA
jgi:hypothetical protein